MSRDRFPPDAIFHKRSGLRDGGFSHAQRKAQFPPKNFIVFSYKLPNIFSCILTKTTLYCNCSKKVLKNSTNAVKHSFTNWLSLFFLSFLLFSSLWSDHTSRSQQSRLGLSEPVLFLSEILFPVLQTENWKQKINDEYNGKPRENGTRSTYSVGLSALRGWIAQNARETTPECPAICQFICKHLTVEAPKTPLTGRVRSCYGRTLHSHTIHLA